MISQRLEYLDVSKNLIITTSPIERAQSSPFLQLSVALPRYGLSFFVNQHGELESRDFKDMVYDENQCIGTMFGLVNRLILRQKVRIEEDLIPRCILIPVGTHRLEKDEYHVRVTINVNEPPRGLGCDGGPITCYAYKVDTELGCLTGTVGLKSRLYLAFLHALTSNVCRSDPLTGRTGLEEAISLIWSTGLRLVPHTPLLDALQKLGSPQLRLAVTKTRDGRTGYDPEQSWYDVLQEAYQFPSEVVPPLPNKDSTSRSCDREPFEEEDMAYTISSAVQLWLLDAPIASDALDWVEVWGDIMIQRLGEPLLLSHARSLDLPENNLPWIKRSIYNILRRTEGRTRHFQLLFFLPTITYFSGRECMQPALIAILVAFAKQLHIPLENHQNWDEYTPLDGYHPDKGSIWRHIKNACHSEWERPVQAERAAVDRLLESWPSETVTVPTDLLNPDFYDVASLTETLQRLFTSCYRNFKLKEHFTCGRSEPKPPRLLNTAPLRYTPETPFGWQITLDRLLRERSSPQLPACHRLPQYDPGEPGNGIFTSSSDIAQLAQLFFSLRANNEAPAFQRQYVADLDASASHFRTEESHTGITSRTIRTLASETLRKHYVQCRVSYRMGLQSLKDALGPRTNIDQALNESGHWPRVTPYTLFRCLASTSPIHPSESWKKCLISLALLALELQRARRLLRLALDDIQDEFLKELYSEGCDGWVAMEHPDWLLMQARFLCSQCACNTCLLSLCFSSTLASREFPHPSRSGRCGQGDDIPSVKGEHCYAGQHGGREIICHHSYLCHRSR